MLSDLLTTSELIHLFPVFFGIILCGLSTFDQVWISAKIENEIGRGERPNRELIDGTKAIANGAASLNVHLINVLLFFVGAALAVSDWPSCEIVWPLLISTILFVIILYDFILTLVRTPFGRFDQAAPAVEETNNRVLFRPFLGRSPSSRLRLEQILFNIVIAVIMVCGVLRGGANDSREVCHGSPPRITSPTK